MSFKSNPPGVVQASDRRRRGIMDRYVLMYGTANDTPIPGKSEITKA